MDASELDDLARRARAGGRASVARESPVSYGSAPSDATLGIDELRARFRPDNVRWLFVGESSPVGGTHFYRADSNLFRATRAAFARALGAEVPDGPAFLHWVRTWGGWLVDIADHPVNRLDPVARTDAVVAGTARLTRTIRDTRPKVIVCVKASIATQVRAAATEAGLRRQDRGTAIPGAKVDGELCRRPRRGARSALIEAPAHLIVGCRATLSARSSRARQRSVSATRPNGLRSRDERVDDPDPLRTRR